MMKPGLYDMIRTTDQTGVSGTGRVAQVAVFADGSAAVRWLTGKDSTVCWARIEDALDVHINCHPDTTRLIPAGEKLCPHGLVVTEEYCDPCAKEEENAETHPYGNPTADVRTAKAIRDWCAARQLRCEEHNSHGLYFDVWIRDTRYMFDCSPEDEPRGQRYNSGLVVVRDSTHHWSNPSRVGSVNMLTAEASALLDTLLNTRPL